jgi:glycosyltransferase involved in cell wall biosynthesis
MPDKNSIVFINQNAGYLLIDIVLAHKDYEKRAVITGKLIPRNTPLPASVKVEKIITYNRNSSIKRILTWSIAFLQILWLVKTRYRKSDLFIVTNPPFAGLIPMFCSNRFSILIYDIYPDALIKYNIISAKSVIARRWKKANSRIFKKAQRVFTISEGMKRVLGQYISPSNIEVVPIWTDNHFLKPVSKEDNVFRNKHNLQDKFVVMYSGNLGHTHNIEVLIDIAASTTDKDICFVIVGEGNNKEAMIEKINQYELTNCLVLPWQAVDMLPYSLSAADLGVITLGKQASTLSVPSKTFNLMSVGVPLLCIADIDSELASLVDRYQIGKCFYPTEIEKIISFIKQVKADGTYRDNLKKNAIIASKDFGPENAQRLVLEKN